MSETVVIGMVRLTRFGRPERDLVCVVALDAPTLEDAALRPETIVAHKIWMPEFAWKAIVALASHGNSAAAIYDQSMRTDSLDNPWRALSDLRSWVYRLSREARVTR